MCGVLFPSVNQDRVESTNYSLSSNHVGTCCSEKCSYSVKMVLYNRPWRGGRGCVSIAETIERTFGVISLYT